MRHDNVKWRADDDLEGRVGDYFNALYWHNSEGTEYNHEYRQSEEPERRWKSQTHISKTILFPEILLDDTGENHQTYQPIQLIVKSKCEPGPHV
jgi:hypothetical protein